MDSFGENEGVGSERQKPSNNILSPLPTSLDDRLSPEYSVTQTEMYDAWQGQTQILTAPMPTRSKSLQLSTAEDLAALDALRTKDANMMDILSEQATNLQISHQTDDEQNISQILSEPSLTANDKQNAMQAKFLAAASNGNTDLLKLILLSPARRLIDIDLPDAEGSSALIYASCFGHTKIVEALLTAGADVNVTDRNQWTPLMWALIGASNSHKAIAKMLLDSGADTAAKSSSGRSAADFALQNREVGGFLSKSGYTLGESVVSDGFSCHDRLEEEYAEREFMRKMMMESSINLEVNLGDLESELGAASPDEDLGQDFVWDRCLNDQMFVFQEGDLDRILDMIITHMVPKRSPSQKPVPANILFLAARYAHYYVGSDLLEILLATAMDKINKKVEQSQWDMTILAFWISNATLLLHYLRKDRHLCAATPEFQSELAELINEIFVLIVRDAERRMDKVFDAALLQYETVPGLDDVAFQGEWNLFKRKSKPEESTAKWIRPPSPRRKAKTSPQTITSLLSSTLFVLDLYDIHSVITTQVLAQLLYWIGAELFNRIISNRRYLARTKAMQIRMNVASLEEWVQANNRVPEHYEGEDTTAKGESTAESARKHFAPVIQLLQWLQCFSSMDDDLEGLVSTLNQLTALNPNQLLHVVKRYRAEVGEPELPKTVRDYLDYLRVETVERFRKEAQEREEKAKRESNGSIKSGMSAKSGRSMFSGRSQALSPVRSPSLSETTFGGILDEPSPPDRLMLDPSLMLPFYLPTPTDMVVRFGAGFGGADRERERKYVPTVPPEFLARLDEGAGANSGPGGQQIMTPIPIRLPELPDSDGPGLDDEDERGRGLGEDGEEEDASQEEGDASGDGAGGRGRRGRSRLKGLEHRDFGLGLGPGLGLTYTVPPGLEAGWDSQIEEADVAEEVEKRDREDEERARRRRREGGSSSRRWRFSLAS